MIIDSGPVAIEELHQSEKIALNGEGLRKVYGATVALEHANISLVHGKVHALLGENGAGKSTLVRILAGAMQPDGGNMRLEDRPYAPNSLMDARDNKVGTAFQELSLVPNISVAQNLLLPHIPTGLCGMESANRTLEMGADILERHGLGRINPKVEISELPLADRQRIEITRALVNSGQVLILDEPTASLAETDWLFEQINLATSSGTAVLYISHRLAEVREICSDATVLRNGSSIASVNLSEASDGDIFEMMVGRKAAHDRVVSRPKIDTSAPPRVSVEGLKGHRLVDVSFELRPGEILGVAALEGQGQHGLFRMLAGLEKVQSGTICVDGTPVNISDPRNALRTGTGVAYLPEERKTEGILAGLSAATNVVLPVIGNASRGSFLSPRSEHVAAKYATDRVEMAERYLSFAIADLSGGNQQKALVARVLGSGAKTLLLFDPTRGVDVGTKQCIYDAIRAFADTGGSVLFYSSELPEIVQLADRCMAIYDGHVFREFEGDAISEQNLVVAILGHDVSEAENVGEIA